MTFTKSLKNLPHTLLAFFFSGCMSYTTLQNAETLEPGKFQVGVGSVVFDDGIIPEIGGRIGIIKNVDMGIKYSYPTLFVIDGKYQFLKSKVDAAFDFGWSHYSGGEVTVNGFYPMFLISQKHWYVGIKGLFINSSGSFDILGTNVELNGSGYNSTSLVTGIILGGEKIKLNLELNSYITKNNTSIFIPAAGIYFVF